jgi:hypothetical protein
MSLTWGVINNVVLSAAEMHVIVGIALYFVSASVRTSTTLVI